MELQQLKIGFAFTGSFCTIGKTIPQMERMIQSGAEIIPIFSPNVATLDNRFNKAAELRQRIEKLTGHQIITTIPEAEPIGPKKLLDALVIAPCTGNTLAKLALGITDTSVTMAAKATLRTKRPVVIAVSTNDGLSASGKNIGALLNTKNIFFVPFAQDDCVKKETSLVAKVDLIIPTLEMALDGRQIQPVIVE